MSDAPARLASTVSVFEINVAAGAVSGSRSLLVRTASDLALMTGAVEVRGVDLPTPTPTATEPMPTATPTTPAGGCIGDCDGGGTVTVDEIVTMVNIALGTPVWMQLTHLLLADLLWIAYVFASASLLDTERTVAQPVG